MNILNKEKNQRIGIIGSGVIGMSIAWKLSSNGFKVTLIDPHIHNKFNRITPHNGTNASLGVLMGYIFKRERGRSWELRKESLDLWKNWPSMLNDQKEDLRIKTPLIKLARSEEESDYLKVLCDKRKKLGLSFLDKETTIGNHLQWENNTFGGIISNNEGQIDPILLQKCLMKVIKKNKVRLFDNEVELIENKSNLLTKRWSVTMKNGEKIPFTTLIICAGVGSNKFLKQAGYKIRMEPIAGQAIEIKIKSNTNNWDGWPAVLSSEGINFIPNGPEKMIIGATIEPGEYIDNTAIRAMQAIDGKAPVWIQDAEITNQWNGIRARPINKPAPLLEKLEEGLLLASGHYRNGILLAPVTAEWVAAEVMKEET